MTQTDLWQTVAIGLLSVALMSLCVVVYRFMDILKDFFEGFHNFVKELPSEKD